MSLYRVSSAYCAPEAVVEAGTDTPDVSLTCPEYDNEKRWIKITLMLSQFCHSWQQNGFLCVTKFFVLMNSDPSIKGESPVASALTNYANFLVLGTLFTTHCVNMAFGLNDKLGGPVKVIKYASYINIAIVLIIGFGCKGGLVVIFPTLCLLGAKDSLAERSLLEFAATFHDPDVTGAVSVGSGFSMACNVTIMAILRFSVFSAMGKTEETAQQVESIAFILWLALTTILTSTGIYLFRWLLKTASYKHFAAQEEILANNRRNASPESVNWKSDSAFWNLATKPIWIMLTCCIGRSSLWPTMPGFAIKQGFGPIWSNPDTFETWWYNPCVTAPYFYGNFIGRYIPCFEAARAFFSVSNCLFVTVSRGFIALVMICCLNPNLFGDYGNWVAMFWIFLMGITQGVVFTSLMIHGPNVVPKIHRGTVLSLLLSVYFFGFGFGALVAGNVKDLVATDGGYGKWGIVVWFIISPFLFKPVRFILTSATAKKVV